MKTIKAIALLMTLSVCILSVSSCYYDKEELLYQNSNAPCTDTISNISYSVHVVPLLNQYCYNCHTGNSPSGGIAMGTYATDKTIAQNGKLYGSVIHASGYKAMPEGTSKLTTCQIAAVKQWIDAGLLNN
jgi:hypothetical protein